MSSLLAYFTPARALECYIFCLLSFSPSSVFLSLSLKSDTHFWRRDAIDSFISFTLTMQCLLITLTHSKILVFQVEQLSLPVDFHDDELGPAEDGEPRDLLLCVGQARLAEPPPVALHVRVRDLAPSPIQIVVTTAPKGLNGTYFKFFMDTLAFKLPHLRPIVVDRKFDAKCCSVVECTHRCLESVIQRPP